jgi:hypothetical protein
MCEDEQNWGRIQKPVVTLRRRNSSVTFFNNLAGLSQSKLMNLLISYTI